MNFLAEPKKGTKWPSNLPRFGSRQEAALTCKELVKNTFIVRCEKHGKGELGVSLSTKSLLRRGLALSLNASV